MNDEPGLSPLLRPMIAAARAAAQAIMAVYATDFSVLHKADTSPVTAADGAAEAVIVKALAALDPALPVIAEEAASSGNVPSVGSRFWLVDPLDGTREFVSRNGEFTVNIALVDKGLPVLGVVLAPALDRGLGRLFAGAVGHGAFVEEAGRRRPIRCRPVPAEGLTVVSSRSHGDAHALQAFLAGRAVAGSMHLGSSLKLCLVAAGEADLYPRFGRTMAWDIAAGHAVLRAAGGHVRTLAGAELVYDGQGPLENPHFVATGLDEPLRQAVGHAAPRA